MDADTLETLRSFWNLQLSEFQADDRAREETFADVVNRYAEPTRHYHTLDHVSEVVVWTRMILATPYAPPTILAAILHDVVYDTRANDNEERSAEYANEVLTALGVPREVREDTSRLILLTKIHEAPKEDPRGCALIDADLCILAADEKRYDEYAAAIRREYDWVPEADFRGGRSRVLQRFLARPRIYRTDLGHQLWESPARANLARELASLEGSR